MIINLRGTSGSGKSTLVRKLMLLYRRTPHHVEGRKQPIGYLCEWPGRVPLWVPGHYEIACGGCDTLSTVPQTYELVREAVRAGRNVIFEGIMVGDDVRHTLAFAADFAITVVLLTTPIEECLGAVQERRLDRGVTEPLNPANTIGRERSHARACERLEKAGVEVLRLGRTEALAECARRLGL